MTVKLMFAHAENGGATARMSIGDATEEDFDYVALVKHLFDNPDDNVIAEIADSYNDEQKVRLQELVSKIETAAKGREAKAQADTQSDLGDIPF